MLFFIVKFHFQFKFEDDVKWPAFWHHSITHRDRPIETIREYLEKRALKRLEMEKKNAQIGQWEWYSVVSLIET